MGVDFGLCFQHTATGFPEGVTFDPTTFVRPQQATSTGLFLLAWDAPFNSPGKSDKKSTQAIIAIMDECKGNNVV